MRPTLRIARGSPLLALVLAAAWPMAAGAQDPVEELRRVLQDVGAETKAPTAFALDFRRQRLDANVKRLETISQLRRAFILPEWKRGKNEAFAKVDDDSRKKIGGLLTSAIRGVVESGDRNAKLAVANLIAEMGPEVRGVDPLEPFGFTRTLTPEVIALTRDPDVAVRQEALRAIGNINAEPKEIIPAITKTLREDSVGPRRLAADALGQILRVAHFLDAKRKAEAKVRGLVDAVPIDVLDGGRAVLAAAAHGLTDKDGQVRSLCLKAMEAAVQGLELPAARRRDRFPPAGQKLAAEEVALIQKEEKAVQAEVSEVSPLLEGFRKQAPALVAALDDEDPLVRLSANAALEAGAETRLAVRRHVLAVPSLSDYPGEKGDDAARADFLSKNDPLGLVVPEKLPVIAAKLGSSDVRVRRLTLDLLGLLEDGAAPVAGALAAALSDPDRFVRAGACRVLAMLPAERVAGAVPRLAALLADTDGSVRTAAARTLEGLGRLAKGAAIPLARAVAQGDVEPRLAAMRALQKLDPSDAEVAIPELTDGLGHADARVRRAAAETLAKIGPSAHSAIPVLRRALGDEDSDVRINASDAILSILRKER